MNLQIWTGYWWFFLIPIILFAGCFLFIRRGENLTAKAAAFLAGSDNRLSLSRLQALAWSLVIYGSFFAAMAVHNLIPPVSTTQAEEYKVAADKAKEQLPVLKDDLQKAESEKDTAEQAKNNAENDFNVADSRLKTLTERNAPEAEIATAKTVLSAAQDELNTRIKVLAPKQQKVGEADGKVKAANESIRIERTFNWVEIPAALLALAGIAIGSGIFSSLISALNKEEKIACVTSIEPISAVEFNDETEYSDTPPTKNIHLLKINGKDLDKTGKVRFGINRILTAYASILYWKSNGTQVVVEVPTEIKFDTLVVDTPNGKLSFKLDDTHVPPKNPLSVNADIETTLSKYETKVTEIKNLQDELKKLKETNGTEEDINNKTAEISTAEGLAEQLKKRLRTTQLKNSRAAKLKLGVSKYFYEFSDLFRDDKNPTTMDLMKFQMFGWTVIAIFIYSWLFLSNITKDIASLPLIPQAIVILTGLSQTGYLAGKGVSGISPNNNQETNN